MSPRAGATIPALRSNRYPLFLLGVLLTVAHGATAEGLRADPIAGASLQYLDGSDWTASAEQVESLPGCKFVPNLDFAIGDRGEHGKAQSKEDCCAQCHARVGCVASVFAGTQCWYKTAAEVSKPGPSGHPTMACVHPTKVVGQLSLPATVPGDLISDLLRNGLIGEPLFEANFLNGSSTWNLPRWLFTKLFDLGGDFLQSSAADGVSLLVFDGVKMGATIYLNGKRLGTATDQFLRYTFPVPNSALAPKANNLTLVFDVGIECDGRWMACTGGWDWAPYSYTSQEGGFTFTKGIWKSVYLVAVANATITAVRGNWLEIWWRLGGDWVGIGWGLGGCEGGWGDIGEILGKTGGDWEEIGWIWDIVRPDPTLCNRACMHAAAPYPAACCSLLLSAPHPHPTPGLAPCPAPHPHPTPERVPRACLGPTGPQMTAQTFYKGPYPVAPLNDTTHSGFRVEVATHLWASVPTSGLLTVTGEWGEVAQVEARFAAGENRRLTCMNPSMHAYGCMHSCMHSCMHACVRALRHTWHACTAGAPGRGGERRSLRPASGCVYGCDSVVAKRPER